jgi:glycosyltransferase involved in cell wall biosynthesis
MLVPGTKHREYMVSRGVSPSRVFIMPNASSIIIKKEDYEEKENLRKRFNIGTRRVILFVGRLIKQKGVDYLINAFAELKKERDDIALLIVGEGEYRGNLELLSRNLNMENSICFTGFVENVNLPPYYLLGDVCVMPSITYGQADAWGFVINEAMYAQKPVIATDAVGAAFDMIRDGVNGFIVPERDSQALYGAMKTILSDSELAKKMGEESKRILEQGFTYERMIEGFNRAVESINKDNK